MAALNRLEQLPGRLHSNPGGLENLTKVRYEIYTPGASFCPWMGMERL
jgi:hypothetical protein